MKYEVKEDKKLPYYGMIDHNKREISINPRRGDVVNTIIHERVHQEYPQMSEKQVVKMSKQIEGSMSVRQMATLMNATVKEMERACSPRSIRTVVNKAKRK